MTLTSAPAFNSAPGDPPDLGVELASYVSALRRRPWWLVAGTVVGLTASLAYGAVQPPAYRATATLAVSSKARLDREAPSVAAGLRAFVANPHALSRVLAAHRLDKPPHSLSPSSFAQSKLVVEDLLTTASLLKVHVTLPEGRLAADVANSLATEAVTQSQSVNADETRALRDLLKGPLDDSRRRLDDLELQLLDQAVPTSRTPLAEGGQPQQEFAPPQGPRSASVGKSAVHNRESRVWRLEAERQVATSIYADILKQYELAGVQVAGTTPVLKLVDPAVASTVSLAPNPLLLATMGAVLGLGVAALLSFAVLFLSRPDSRSSLPSR